jgi:uncharacterized protein with PQ loop repeat
VLHFYYRSRISKNKNKDKHFLIDSLAYFSGIVSPFMIIPQLYGIWINKNAAGVSAFSFASLALFNFIFIIYGIVNRNKLIAINNSIWCILQILIAIGVILYR